MSIGSSVALQEAVFGALASDVAVQTLTSGAVFDAEPAGVLPPIYISLGPEVVRLRSDKTAGGALHDFVVSIVSEAPGFAAAKSVAVAIGDRLIDSDLALSRGQLVSLRFQRAKAIRVEKGDKRRIDLTFRARISE